jgi:hypothetical protein
LDRKAAKPRGTSEASYSSPSPFQYKSYSIVWKKEKISTTSLNTFSSHLSIHNTKSASIIKSNGCILWFDANDPNNNGIQPANSSSITTWYSLLGNNATANTEQYGIF